MDGNAACPQFKRSVRIAQVRSFGWQITVFDNLRLPLNLHDVTDFIFRLLFGNNLKRVFTLSQNVMADEYRITDSR